MQRRMCRCGQRTNFAKRNIHGEMFTSLHAIYSSQEVEQLKLEARAHINYCLRIYLLLPTCKYVKTHHIILSQCVVVVAETVTATPYQLKNRTQIIFCKSKDSKGSPVINKACKNSSLFAVHPGNKPNKSVI